MKSGEWIGKGRQYAGAGVDMDAEGVHRTWGCVGDGGCALGGEGGVTWKGSG